MNEFCIKCERKSSWGIIECNYTGIVEDQFSHVWFNSIIYTDLYIFPESESGSPLFEMRKLL